jgi:hypothetical protein
MSGPVMNLGPALGHSQQDSSPFTGSLQRVIDRVALLHGPRMQRVIVGARLNSSERELLHCS